ncbi:uncharacterized protein LOC127833809 isoform X1 [Dreissena polymorpha]|nr:uncharacterized protein LOC127833809 isoform X1 [Dreissena polymorpha]
MAEGGNIDAGVDVSSDMTGDCIVIRSCEPCMRKKSANTASVICKVCNEHLCGPCSHLHEIYKPGEHKMVVIESVNSTPVEVNMKGMNMCQEHGKKIKFFCEDHSKLCCNTCSFKHRKCDNVDELASISSKEGQELQHLNKTLLKLENEIASIGAECKLSEDVLSETTASIAKQIDEMRGRIIELFDKAKTKMIEEADTFKADEMKRLGEINKSSSNVKENINELLPVSSALVEHGTPQQKYIMAKIIKEKIKDITSNITEQRSKFVTSTVSLDFSKQLLSLLKEEGIIKLQVERHHTDVVQTYLTEIQESSEVKAETTNLNKDCSTDSAQSDPNKPVTMELLVSVDIKQTGDDLYEPYLSGLDFLPDGRLVAVENMNWKCIIMDDRLQILGTPYKFNAYPYDVVCLSQCEVAVTTNSKKVCLLYVSSDNVISLTRQINTSTYVFSICCMTPTTMVVSTYDDPRPVRMINQTGVESDFDRVLFNKKTYKHEDSKASARMSLQRKRWY